jgi:hypothetical protein
MKWCQTLQAGSISSPQVGVCSDDRQQHVGSCDGSCSRSDALLVQPWQLRNNLVLQCIVHDIIQRCCIPLFEALKSTQHTTTLEQVVLVWVHSPPRQMRQHTSPLHPATITRDSEPEAFETPSCGS